MSVLQIVLQTRTLKTRQPPRTATQLSAAKDKICPSVKKSAVFILSDQQSEASKVSLEGFARESLKHLEAGQE
ncbi:MAG TPA: hypothetical protein DCP64_11685 [Sarcina sp.]|nr:hypothetical protein [Sarcina sp.]